jgi:hypothetical protein
LGHEISVVDRVTRLGDFLPIGLFLKDNCD